MHSISRIIEVWDRFNNHDAGYLTDLLQTRGATTGPIPPFRTFALIGDHINDLRELQHRVQNHQELCVDLAHELEMQIVMEDNKITAQQQETGQLVKRLTIVGLLFLPLTSTTALFSSLFSLCMNIYNDKPTPDQSLQEHARLFKEAMQRLEVRCSGGGFVMTEAETKTLEIARQCQATAQQLEAEVTYVTGLQAKGKLAKAFHAALRSTKHQSNLQRLEKELRRHGEVMQTHLLSQLCTHKNATELQLSNSFQHLESDVQSLVVQIAQGNKEVGELVKTEHLVSRAHLTAETAKSQSIVNQHVTSELQGHSLEAAAKNRRERLLESFRCPEMNQRFNEVTDPRDATFERIFTLYDQCTHAQASNSTPEILENSSAQKSLEQATHSVISDEANDESKSSTGYTTKSDRWQSPESKRQAEEDAKLISIWHEFVHWLQSKDPIFWIRGKPGSGKSTLMKFVIRNKNTSKLLASWGSEVKIIPHFFWKIGSQPQRSIKGFLSSIIYHALQGNALILNSVSDQFSEASSKSSPHDWSEHDLIELLFYICTKDLRNFCIFVDGLDEVCSTDGPEKLLDLLQRLAELSTVKLIEELTKPDMQKYAQNCLGPFKESGAISYDMYDKLSVADGARNLDSEEELLSRLQQLPPELDDLYADMWQRLNHHQPIYRKAASQYFRLALNKLPRKMFVYYSEATGAIDSVPQEPSVLHMACMKDAALQERLCTRPSSEVLPEVVDVCRTVEHDITVRCAGLLDVRYQKRQRNGKLYCPLSETTGTSLRDVTKVVVFVHRTAHDFLVSTETGQEILKYSQNLSHIESASALLYTFVCIAGFMSRAFEVHLFLDIFLYVLDGMLASIKKGDRLAFRKVYDVAQDESKHGYTFMPDATFTQFYWQSGFLQLAAGFPHLADYVLFDLERLNAHTVTNMFFAKIWDGRQRFEILPSAEVIEAVLHLGGDPHAVTITATAKLLDSPQPCYEVVRKSTFFKELLFKEFMLPSEYSQRAKGQSPPHHLLKSLIIMASSCPDLRNTTLLLGKIDSRSGPEIHSLAALFDRWELARIGQRPIQVVWVVWEVTLDFLVQNVVTRLLRDSDIPASLLQESQKLLKGGITSLPAVRLIVSDDENSGCYQVVSQSPFEEITENIMAPLQSSNDDMPKKLYSRVLELIGDEDIAEQVDFRETVEALFREVQLCPKDLVDDADITRLKLRRGFGATSESSAFNPRSLKDMIQPTDAGSGDKRPSSRLPVNPRRHKVAPEQRKRVATAIKCSGERPCRQCASSSRECIYPVSTDKVTISRPELDDLRRKLEMYERALQDTVPDASRLQELLQQFAAVSPESSTSPSSAPASTPASVAEVASFEAEAAALMAPSGDGGVVLGAVEGRLLRDAEGTARFFGRTSAAVFLDHLRDFLSSVAPLAMARQIILGSGARDTEDSQYEDDNSAIASFLQNRGTYQTLDSSPLAQLDVSPLLLPPTPTLIAMMAELRHVIQDGNGEAPSGGIYWFGDLATVPSLPPQEASAAALRPLAFHHAAIALITQTATQRPSPGGTNSAEAFFARAHRLLGNNPLDISQCRTMGEAATLMMMGLFLVQTNRRETAAAYFTAAVRAAVSLGAHRGWSDESGRRVFWTAYALDRWMSCLLGRPPAITDEMIQLAPPQDAPGLPSPAGLRAHIELARISGLINSSTHRPSSPEEAARILERTIWMLDRWQSRLPPALHLVAGIGKDPACCLLHMQHNHLVILATRPVFFSAVRHTFAERLVTKAQPSIEGHPQLRHLQGCAGAAQRILQLARAGQHQQQRQGARRSVSPVLLHGGLQFVLDAAICLLLQELVTDDGTADGELPSRNGAVDFAMALFREEGGDFAHDCAEALHQLRVLVGRLRKPMEGSFLAGQSSSAIDLNADGDASAQLQGEELAKYEDLVEWMHSEWPMLDYTTAMPVDEEE
ncbi:transcriptional regulatory protein [Paramyrothecium foliicola]|nr:transcriptional regulatory protein [Paramyrothecium foliicola]